MYSLPIVPRFAEIDQQGVVFNAHYLTWFDEACGGFLGHLGVPYPELIDSGYDIQVVHTEIDFTSPVGWRDVVRVAVACERIGSTSFTLGFAVLRRVKGSDDIDGADDEIAVRGHNVYVVVSTDDWGKREIPDGLREALSSVDGKGIPSTHGS